MLYGIDNIKAWLNQNKIKSFRLYSARNVKVPVFTYTEDSESGALGALDSYLSLHAGQPVDTEFLITGYPKGTPKKSRTIADGEESAGPKDYLQTKFILPKAGGVMPIAGVGCPSGACTCSAGMNGRPGANTLAEAVAAARKEWELEKKVDDLIKEAKENKSFWDKASEPGGFFERLAGNPQIMGAISGLAGNLFGGPAPVGLAGAVISDQPAAPDEKINIQERISQAIRRLYKKDPELCVHLEKLADLAENNPGQFQFMIQALSNL